MIYRGIVIVPIVAAIIAAAGLTLDELDAATVKLVGLSNQHPHFLQTEPSHLSQPDRETDVSVQREASPHAQDWLGTEEPAYLLLQRKDNKMEAAINVQMPLNGDDQAYSTRTTLRWDDEELRTVEFL